MGIDRCEPPTRFRKQCGKGGQPCCEGPAAASSPVDPEGAGPMPRPSRLGGEDNVPLPGLSQVGPNWLGPRTLRAPTRSCQSPFLSAEGNRKEDASNAAPRGSLDLLQPYDGIGDRIGPWERYEGTI